MTTDDYCAGCAIECLCDTSKYGGMSDAQLDAIASLDVNLADDTSIDREKGRRAVRGAGRHRFPTVIDDVTGSGSPRGHHTPPDPRGSTNGRTDHQDHPRR